MVAMALKGMIEMVEMIESRVRILAPNSLLRPDLTALMALVALLKARHPKGQQYR